MDRFFGRLSEWALAGAMLAIGAHVSIVPTALLNSRMSPILAIVWLPLLCAIYISTGCARIAALTFTGQWTHNVRAVGSLIGAANWAQFGFALIATSVDLKISVSPLVWLYTFLTAAEFASTYRARADVNAKL